MRTILGAVIVALCAASSGVAQDWDKADEAVRRLPLSAFPELPAAIAHYLERRGCTVPQDVFAQYPARVLSSHFSSANQTDWDWAVLCSVRRVSTILVFRNGSADHVAELAGRPDSYSLKVVADGVIGYDRSIGVAAPGELQAYKERYKASEPQSWTPKGGFDHDGIEDGSEKGSGIYYWSGGYWYEYPGGD